MDDLFYMIYAMFAIGDMTTGCLLLIAGCILAVTAVIAALVMALTGKGSRRRIDQKMQERY